ncbi:MAG TPA: CDP-alcohol phosphatidyltransferase family protein [Gemmatimonadaceae bacterium]|nr:CDP-alcohol phosphatidyltransferase family protein [Gemmatimonadaceae bacterium]
MNLPNALTASRIAATPLIATLPLSNSWGMRFVAFVLFAIAAISDYVDGRLARSRKEETDLGRLLDPLADKLLLLGTFVPMYLLASKLPFHTPVGSVGLSGWIVGVVLAREVIMTIFRHFAKRRGVVIAAIGPAKWKTGFQLLWQGSAYCWFFASTLAATRGWNNDAWNGFALFNGTVGAIMMLAAVVLTVYSLAIYLRSFSGVFAVTPAK